MIVGPPAAGCGTPPPAHRGRRRSWRPPTSRSASRATRPPDRPCASRRRRRTPPGRPRPAPARSACAARGSSGSSCRDGSSGSLVASSSSPARVEHTRAVTVAVASDRAAVGSPLAGSTTPAASPSPTAAPASARPADPSSHSAADRAARAPATAPRVTPRNRAPRAHARPSPAGRRLDRDRLHAAAPLLGPARKTLLICGEPLLDTSPNSGSSTAAWKTCLWMSIAAYSISDLLSTTEARSSSTPRTEPYDIHAMGRDRSC
jgi:hypothetical protein